MSDIAPETDAEVPEEFGDDVIAALEARFAAPDAEVEEGSEEAAGEPIPEPEAEEPSGAAAYGMSDEDADNLLRWASELTPEQIAAINGVLTAQPEAAASGHGSPAPRSSAPGAGEDHLNLPDLPDLSLLAEAVPGLKEYLAAEREALLAIQRDNAMLRSQQGTLVDDQARRNQQATDAAVESGIAAFREAQPDLTDEQFQAVFRRATDLQVLGPLTQRNGGDIAKATAEALATAMWSDPAMQETLMQQRLATISAEQAETSDRKRRAAALSGGSGSVPGSRSSAAPVNLTPEQRRQAMVADMAAEIAGRSSS